MGTHGSMVLAEQLRELERYKKAEAAREAEEEAKRDVGEILHYSPAILVQTIIDHPDWDNRQLAAKFGRPASWYFSTLASDSFQAALDPRRHEIADPRIVSTMEERFRALTLHSMETLHKKMDEGKIDDFTVLKALETGVKALGLGQPKVEEVAAPVTKPITDLAAILIQRTQERAALSNSPSETLQSTVIDVESRIQESSRG
jgi:hypothetical protein